MNRWIGEAASTVRDWKISVPAGLLLIALFLGVWWGWDQIYEGTTSRSGDLGFTQNLISEGLGVLVSTIIIAPLTAYFVEKKRQSELVSVRATFWQTFASRLENLANKHLFALAGIALTTTTLQTLTTTNKLKGLVERLSLSGLSLPRSDQGQTISIDPDISNAAQQVGSAIRQGREVRADIEAIERLIEVNLSILTPKDITNLNNMLHRLHTVLHGYWELEQYVVGAGDPERESGRSN